MKNLKTRVAALELQSTRDPLFTAESFEAYGRIHDHLKNVLTADLPMSQSPGSGNDSCYGQGGPFRSLISALHERISAGTMTEADRLVLDSIPEDDLTTMRATATDAIAVCHSYFCYMYDFE